MFLTCKKNPPANSEHQNHSGSCQPHAHSTPLSPGDGPHGLDNDQPGKKYSRTKPPPSKHRNDKQSEHREKFASLVQSEHELLSFYSLSYYLAAHIVAA